MKRKLYTIYDSVLMEYSAPFMANNDNHARMIFDRSVSNAQANGFGSEFKLIMLTDFDTSTGELASLGIFHSEVTEIPKDPQKDLFEEDS